MLPLPSQIYLYAASNGFFMKFVDSTQIRVRSGAGGAGMVSFRAARNMPKLGADGGDGGFGGSVYLVGDLGLNTLSGMYYRQLYDAENGQRGGTNGKTGRDGEDLIIPVPLGTVAINEDSGEVIGEVMADKERLLIAQGGKRGLGNLRYLSATHQAPEEHTGGGPSVELNLRMELKVIADVGFAGFPNAGKSTLLSRISRAKPKIADYPFTTLVPNLGVVTLDELTGKSFVAADIPGLIEGAHEGKGLGHEFLKHLERTKVIAFVLDGFSVEGLRPVDAFEKLRHELNSYSEELVKKKFHLILTKEDLKEYNEEWNAQLEELKALNFDVSIISAVKGAGLPELKRKLFDLIEAEKTRIEPSSKVESTKKEDYEGWKFVHRADDSELNA